MAHRARRNQAGSGARGGHLAAATARASTAAEAVPRATHSRRALQAVFEAAEQVIVLMDIHGTILTINEAGAQSLGKPVDEIVGRCIYDVLPAAAAKRRKAKADKAMTTRRPVHFEDERQGRWFENTFYPLVDERGDVTSLAAFAQETTARKLLDHERESAIDELERLALESGHQRNFYARLLDGIPIEIAYLDDSLVYREVNRAAARSLGLHKKELLGRSLQDIPHDDPATVRTVKEVIRTARPATSTVKTASSGGHSSWRTISYVPDKDKSGRVRGVVRQALDVTELMAARERAEVTSKELATANSDLIASNKELAAVMGHAAAHIAYFDPDFNLITANAAYVSGSGRTRSELIGHNHFELFPDPENRALFEEARRTGRAVHRKAHPTQFPTQPWLGTTYWNWTLTPVKDNKGAVSGLVFSRVDVTETIRSKQLTEALAEIEAAISTKPNPDEILLYVVHSAAEAIGCETAVIALRDGAEWVSMYSHNMPAAQAGLHFSDDDVPHGTLAAKTRKPVCIDDTAKDARSGIQSLATRGIRSTAVVPIIVQKQVDGLIFFNYESGVRSFSEAEIEFASKLSSLLSLALDNTQLHLAVRKELSRTQVLQDVAVAATANPDLDGTARDILSALSSRLGLKSGAIHILDRGAHRQKLIAAMGYPGPVLDSMKDIPISKADYLSTKAMRCGELLTHDDDKLTPARARALQQAGIGNARYLVAPIEYRGEVVGIYSLAFPGKRHFTDAELELFNSIGHVVGQAVGNAALFESQVRAQRRAAEELAVSNTLLDASERLATARNTKATLEALADATLQVTGKGRVTVIVPAKNGRDLIVAASRGRRRPRPGFTFPMDSVPASVRSALASTRPQVAKLQRSRLSARQRLWMNKYEFRRVLLLPLMLDDSSIGHVAIDDPGQVATFSAREIRLAEGVAAQAAVALENARFHEESLTKARNLATVSQMGTLITSTLSLRETSRQILDYSAVLLNTPSSTLLLLDRDAGLFRIEASEGITRRVWNKALSVQDAVKLGFGAPEPVVIGDMSSVAAIPFFAANIREGYAGAVVAAMFIDSRLDGLLMIQDKKRMSPSTEDVGAFRLFTNQAATAIKNARLYEEQRRIAEILQQSLIKPVADLPLVQIGIVYKSAQEAERVGGDFYDAFELDDDRIAILIGDVSGKGITAAGMTETIKSSVRTLAYIDPSPAFVFSRLNQSLLRQLDLNQFATASLLVIDLRTGELTIANAGHPRPLLCDRKSAHMMKVPPGQLLGAFASSYRESYMMMRPGQTVVLYTDGITEARSGKKFFGDRRLLKAVSSLKARQPQVMVEGVMRAAADFAKGDLRDDVVVVGVRLESLASGRGRRARDKQIATRAHSG